LKLLSRGNCYYYGDNCSILLSRNRVSIANIAKLRDMRDRKQIKKAVYDEEVKKIKAAKDGQVVIIKPTDESTYKNLVAALDEMQICSIGIYAIVAVEEPDRFLMKNLKGAGALTAQADFDKAKAK